MLTSSQHQEPSGESRIDKMRKFLSSPLTRKKTPDLLVKTFGTPLDTLLQRTISEHSVPFVITRLCQYILRSGMTHEGLFRISGNARSVERLKTSFDRTGDAPLETEGDVPTAAALLKLFLRELPDPIIPLDMHCQFLEAVKDKDKEESIACLTELVEKLPLVNYAILSYLFSFLKQVSDMQEQNRMSASSLGIVFGPNLFRVTEDFVGLKEQSFTNQIVTYFITNHHDIFKDSTKLRYTSYSCETNNTGQSMVSSWPEGRGSSSSMLSTWSLGPLTCAPDVMDDSLYSLKPLSQSIGRTETIDSGFTSLKLEDNIPSSETDFRLCRKDVNSEFAFCMSRNSTRDLNSIQSSSPRDSKDKKSIFSLGKESCLKDYYIMEEPPLLCHTALKVPPKNADIFLQQDETRFPCSKSMTNSFNHLSYQKDYSLDSPSCSSNGLHHQSRITHEKSEEILKDIHKSYPRGRRRHVHHHKSKSYEDGRRSHSEIRHSTLFGEENDSSQISEGSLTHVDKLDMQHASTGNMDEISIESQYSWPPFRKSNEEEDITLSPLPQQLEVTICDEASISPSAFRSYLSHRNLHLDPNLPPSPPVEQEDLAIGVPAEVPSVQSKQLTKRVHALKKKIKSFEENFEKLHGYKPSHAEKCNNFSVRKLMSEINKARLDLKQLKEESPRRNLNDSGPSTSSTATNTRSSQGLFATAEGSSGNQNLEDTIRDSYLFLTRCRNIDIRPENLEDMSLNDLVQEKAMLQRVLLNLEDLHGRPRTQEHDKLTKPLYDRYLNTKRLIARSDADLIPIMENTETTNFKKADLDKSKIGNDEQNRPAEDQQEALDFSSILMNFRDRPLSELESNLHAAREEKRRLRKLLKDFEDEFQRVRKRKAQRADKRPMEKQYAAYKNVKANINLLEKLISKHRHNSSI